MIPSRPIENEFTVEQFGGALLLTLENCDSTSSSLAQSLYTEINTGSAYSKTDPLHVAYGAQNIGNEVVSNNINVFYNAKIMAETIQQLD